ncbi:MAG: type II toxin-antitoxin system VapC family toxin [Gemmataceae bacterium]|nr:type II toxin-antitoxin system VapC family toxin [Gemmataceae bacterium]
MTFADIPAGQVVFIDANIFIYYFRPDPVLGSACAQLLQRIENGEIDGITSSHILSETVHRLMTNEASQRFAWPMTGIIRRMRNHPSQLQQLSRHRQAIDELALVGVRVLDVTRAQVSLAADHSCQHGLLSSDALLVAVMHAHGLTDLASHDADFDRVPGITRHAPV